MGTRSSSGFIIDGEYKSTYNQFDGYYGGVGQGMVDFANKITSENGWEQFKENARKVVLVSNDEPPTEEIQQRYIDAGFYNSSVSEQSPEDWYCLLRELQGGDIFYAIYAGNVEHMLGANKFILESLFCEYAYIINLDDMTFEVYDGFQKQKHYTNRFGSELPEGEDYYPCKLVKTIPLVNDSEDSENIRLDIIGELTNTLIEKKYDDAIERIETLKSYDGIPSDWYEDLTEQEED